MGYTTNESAVRADLFTENGKWKYSISLDMEGNYDEVNIWKAIPRIVRSQYGSVVHKPYEGMWIVILEPCWKYSHPIMMKLVYDD